MEREFTPGALRALAAAATWQLGETFDGLRPVTILMGLLAEPECRAAALLRAIGIEETAILNRWPELRRSDRPPVITPESPPAFHAEAESILEAVDTYMDWGDWPPIISTEHLLLGLVAGDEPVACWLREMGLEFHDLLRQILERYGTATKWRSPTVPLELSSSSEAQPEGEAFLPFDPEAAHRASPLSRQAPEITSSSESTPQRFDNREEKTRDSLGIATEMRLFRMVDAALNRAMEGFRVIEDYARFALDHPLLVREIKNIRHELAGLATAFPMPVRLAARETQHDVGTEIKATTELHRMAVEDLVDANFSRVEEALRSIEECAKILVPQVAFGIEQLRYRCYTVHRALRISETAAQRLQNVRLYVLVDARSSAEELRNLVGSLIDAGVHAIQLREKHLCDRLLLERARLIREMTRGTNTLFIMNDRADLAVLSEADGVHVGQEELTVKDARFIVGPRALVGVSTHNIEQARQAVLDGADYIGCGPTFPSTTKSFSEFAGLDFLRQVAQEIRLPAFAIGGINEENLASVLATGIQRVAVSGCVIQAANPAEVARRLLARLERPSVD